MRPVIIIALFALTGCTSSYTGVKWWSPATWGSGSEARKADKAVTLVDLKREQTLRAAQSAVHESLFALILAGASRATETAKESAQTAASLLDQALGALPLDEMTRLRLRVDGLLSDNADLRERAEKDRAQARQNAATLALELDKARGQLKTAQEALASAFQRENALANTLRNERMVSMFWKIGLGTGLLVVGGLYLYVRFVAGGIPGALGKMLASTNAKNPALAASLRAELDPWLNRIEQAKIKQMVVKEATKLETA